MAEQNALHVFLFGNASFEGKLKKLCPNATIHLFNTWRTNLQESLPKFTGSMQSGDIFIASVACVGHKSIIERGLQLLAEKGVKVYIITNDEVPSGVRAFRSKEKLFAFLREDDRSIYSEKNQKLNPVRKRRNPRRSVYDIAFEAFEPD